MRARWPCLESRLAALAAVPVAAAVLASTLAGCGGVGVSGAATAGNQLTIYSSLPLQGASASVSTQIVNGEKLALAEAGGRVGPFKVSYFSLDDSSPTKGQWDPGVTATNAKTAAADTTTIAYLGDYNSQATAVSLPLTNAAGILQVSPASPYVGLTSSVDAGQYEPERFYPTGRRTFGRLQPSDLVEAAAQVQLMRQMAVSSVYLLNDQDPFAIPLTQLVAADAEHAGIAVAGQASLDMNSTRFTGEAEKISESGAQAVLFAGGSGPGTVALWRQLHSADPKLLLLGSSTMVNDSFASGIGAAGDRTYLTTPALAPSLYPPAAGQVLGRYRSEFDVGGGAYALYGYEAMSVVLDSIRTAGSHGSDRQAVIERFFSVRNRNSVLGRYSMQADGDTTLARYGVDEIVNGRPAFYRAVALP